MGERVTALLPFLSPEQVRLYHPLILPIGLQFGSFVLLALGLAPRTEARQPRRKKGNRGRKPRKALAQKTPPAANVVGFPASHRRA